MRRVYIYKRYERFWHWLQVLLVIILAVTGFEIHGSYKLLGFETAVTVHNVALWTFIILTLFTIFWHFTTGEWKKYKPSSQKVSVTLKYYTSGMFKNEPHPYKKTELSRLNPIQRITYLLLKIVLFPVMILTGLVYFFYNDLVALGFGPYLGNVAGWHTLGAFAIVAFTFVHTYMVTTGQTLTSNIKAMVTGWEEIEDSPEAKEVPEAEEGDLVPDLAPGD